MADPSLVSAVSLPPKEAIAFLRQKVNVPTQPWSDVWNEAHSRAFSVAGAASADLVQDFRDAVAKALEHGTSMADFRKDFDTIVARHGWVHNGTPAWRANIIFETNLSTAYSADRYVQLTEPDVLEAYPFWRYQHNAAVHPRVQHVAWSGLTLKADDPWWRTHFPPNGWRCHCSVSPVSERGLTRMGKAGPDEAPPLDLRTVRVRVGDEIRAEQVPRGIDASFGYNPGMAWQGRVQPGQHMPLRAEAVAPERRAAGLPPRQPASVPELRRFLASPAGDVPVGVLILIPWNDANNRSEFAAELDRRFTATVKLDAIGFMGVRGTYGTQTGFGDAGNNKGIVTVGAAGMLESPWKWAAAWCGVHAFRLINDPSRQSRAIAVVDLTAPDDADVFTPQQSNLLLFNGVSTWEKLPDGTVVIDRTISGYMISNLGVPDTAWLDIMAIAVATRIRYDWRSYIKLLYPNAKLFDDGSIGAVYDPTAATPKRLDAAWAGRCLQYERAGWIEGSALTINAAKHMRDPSDVNRANGKLQYRRAGNLMVLAEVLEFAA